MGEAYYAAPWRDLPHRELTHKIKQTIHESLSRWSDQGEFRDGSELV